MDSFVKYFYVCRIEELEEEINNYIKHTDNKLEVTAIAFVPSPYYSYIEAIVAFRRI